MQLAGRCSRHERTIADLDDEAADLDTAKRDIDAKLKTIDDEEVQITREQIDMLDIQFRRIDRNLSGDRDGLDRYRKKINELEGIIRRQQRGLREARDLEAYQETAKVIVRILGQAYATIRDDQVNDLGREMNRLFTKMAANVIDDEAVEGDRHKATLRMIASVGLRPLEGESGQFEIFALNSRDRSMGCRSETDPSSGPFARKRHHVDGNVDFSPVGA